MAQNAYDRKEDFIMALTKAKLKEMLSAANCPEEGISGLVDKILEGHLTSITALREERDGYKADAEKYQAAQKKLDEVQTELNGIKAKGNPDWQQKYESEKLAFENYKNQISAEKVKAEKKQLYRALLTESGVEKSRLDAIIKVTDLDALTVKDGKFENVDDLKKSIADEWSGFIMKPGGSNGADVPKPPQNPGAKPTEEPSRAKQLAQQYHENLYGKSKED